MDRLIGTVINKLYIVLILTFVYALLVILCLYIIINTSKGKLPN